MKQIEIRKVRNGYMLLPAYSPADGPQIHYGDHVMVFENFDAMAAYLKKEFENEANDDRSGDT